MSGAAFPAAALGVGGRTSGRAVRVSGGGMLYLEIEADAFLRHMVRTLVGTMIEVGRGERTLDDFAQLVDGAHPRGGRADGPRSRALPLGRTVRAACGKIPW